MITEPIELTRTEPIEIVNVQPAALSTQMQTIATGYIDARKRAGYAWLDMGRFLTEARQAAKHGEWGVFLQATNTSEDQAKRLMAIYAQSLHDRAFADAVRTNVLNVSTAYELTTAPPDVQQRLLEGSTPITREQIREEKRAANPAPAPTLDTESTAAPDLADMLLRLDAHGYAKTGTRQKGITTFYSFRDFRSTLEDDQAGEIELAEGELPYWLSELDDNAQRAQAKQERYLDAQMRADRLGYTLTRDGTDFVLSITGSAVALRGTLDATIKTIEGYEKNAAKRAAVPAPAEDNIPHLPPDFTAVQKRANAIGLHISMDMHGLFGIMNDRNSGVDHIAEWDSLKRHLTYSEQAAAEIAAERRAKQPSATLSIDLQQRLVAAGAGIGSDGTVYAPKGSGESPTILSADEAEQAMIRWAACAAETPQLSKNEQISAGAKRRAIGLLKELEPLMKLIKTEDIQGLAGAMEELNMCEEGSEGEYWVRVGYALCDVEP